MQQENALRMIPLVFKLFISSLVSNIKANNNYQDKLRRLSTGQFYFSVFLDEQPLYHYINGYNKLSNYD